MRYLGWIVLSLGILELLSIILVSGWIGGGWTLLLILISFMTGILMLRHSGISGLLVAGASIRSGAQISLYQLLWPIRYIVAALMLMSPGFFSDVIAFVLLIPFAGKPLPTTSHYQNRTETDDIIEGEYTVKSTDTAGRQNPDIPKLH